MFIKFETSSWGYKRVMQLTNSVRKVVCYTHGIETKCQKSNTHNKFHIHRLKNFFLGYRKDERLFQNRTNFRMRNI